MTVNRCRRALIWAAWWGVWGGGGIDPGGLSEGGLRDSLNTDVEFIKTSTTWILYQLFTEAETK